MVVVSPCSKVNSLDESLEELLSIFELPSDKALGELLRESLLGKLLDKLLGERVAQHVAGRVAGRVPDYVELPSESNLSASTGRVTRHVTKLSASRWEDYLASVKALGELPGESLLRKLLGK
jgi:hypothetical protein